MKSLAAFDFDMTIVNADCDDTLMGHRAFNYSQCLRRPSRAKKLVPPPDWDPDHDMSEVFEHAYSAGLSQDDILSSIASMRPNPGLDLLLSTLASEGWDVVILTDANTIFVQHWLKTHGLMDAVTSIISNRSFWQDGRLYIEPCMRQSACPRCPANLCKSLALAQFCAARPAYRRVVYAGDGRNDYCPTTNLPPHSTVFPRRGYPLDDLIKKTLATPNPAVKAKVVPWDDGYTIIRELFPERDLPLQ